MANVFSELKKAADEEILRQVATLEVVTIKNIVGTEGMKAVDKAAGLVNSVGRLLGVKKRLVKDVQPKSIEEQIEEKVAERTDDGREVLEKDLRQLLATRLSLPEDVSDELLSKELMKRAASYLGINEVLTPAERVDAVFEGYRKRLEEKLGEAQAESWEGIRKQLEQGQKFEFWQYMRGLSGVDGEIYCQLALMARFLHGRTFSPQEADLPDWLTGQDEEARKEIAASDKSFQVREAELKEARAGRAEVEQELRDALKRAESARLSFSRHHDYLVAVQEQVENFETNRLNAEIDLGVLEGQLLMVAKAAKKSASTINKLKKAVLSQREKIADLKREHEANLITIEQAPERELQLRQLVEQSEDLVEKKRADLREAEAVLAAATEARDAERHERKERLRQGLADWQEQVISVEDCEFDDLFLNQLAMTNNENHQAVLKAVLQVWEAETPQDMGEMVGEDCWQLSIRGTGFFLIYTVREDGRLAFLRYTERESLAELQQEREAKKRQKEEASITHT